VVLEPAGQVDGVAHRRQLEGCADGTDERRAGVDPDPHGDVDLRVGHERRERRLERQSRSHGPLGVVLPGRVAAPHRHDAIAHVLVDPPAVLDDDDVEPRPDVVHDIGHELRVHSFRHGGEPAHVGEQDRDLTAPLLRRVGAHQLSAQRGDGRVDDVVRHGAPQRLLCGDGQLELLSIGRHSPPNHRAALDAGC
jgi:hypothetical protein